MTLKKWVWFGVTVGSTIGSFIPMLWGGSAFSMTAFILSFVGAFAGIFGGYWLGKRY